MIDIIEVKDIYGDYDIPDDMYDEYGNYITKDISDRDKKKKKRYKYIVRSDDKIYYFSNSIKGSVTNDIEKAEILYSEEGAHEIAKRFTDKRVKNNSWSYIKL